MRTLPFAVVMLCAGSVLAQADNKLYFPPVFATQEGDSVNTTIFGTNGYIHWQQDDSSTQGTSHLIKFLRFRRDGQAAAPGATARMVDVELTLGEGGVLIPYTNDFNANLLTKQTVLPRTTISLPDWSATPSCDPDTFTLSLPGNLYSFGPQLELIWDIQVWSMGTGGHPMDATAGNGSYVSSQCILGTGCNGFTDLTSYGASNNGASTALTLAASSAPANQPVTFLIGLVNPNLTLPGFCAAIHTDGLITAGAGVSSGSGDISKTLPLGTYPLSYGGFQIYTQAVSLQPPSTLAISSGSQVTLPYVPVGNPIPIKHIYSTVQGSATGMGPFDGGVVVEVDDGISG